MMISIERIKIDNFLSCYSLLSVLFGSGSSCNFHPASTILLFTFSRGFSSMFGSFLIPLIFVAGPLSLFFSPSPQSDVEPASLPKASLIIIDQFGRPQSCGVQLETQPDCVLPSVIRWPLSHVSFGIERSGRRL